MKFVDIHPLADLAAVARKLIELVNAFEPFQTNGPFRLKERASRTQAGPRPRDYRGL
jgi:hypothetical protein